MTDAERLARVILEVIAERYNRSTNLEGYFGVDPAKLSREDMGDQHLDGYDDFVAICEAVIERSGLTLPNRA